MKICLNCGRTYNPFHPESKFCSFGCGVMSLTGEVPTLPEEFTPNTTFEKPQPFKREYATLQEELKRYSDDGELKDDKKRPNERR